MLTGVNTSLLVSGKEQIFNVRKYFVVNTYNNINKSDVKELDLNVRTFSIKIISM